MQALSVCAGKIFGRALLGNWGDSEACVWILMNVLNCVVHIFLLSLLKMIAENPQGHENVYFTAAHKIKM